LDIGDSFCFAVFCCCFSLLPVEFQVDPFELPRSVSSLDLAPAVDAGRGDAAQLVFFERRRMPFFVLDDSDDASSLQTVRLPDDGATRASEKNSTMRPFEDVVPDTMSIRIFP
ncbi:unnamed protein product, partial [Ectocarpus sp. 8 AP-2014]